MWHVTIEHGKMPDLRFPQWWTGGLWSSVTLHYVAGLTGPNALKKRLVMQEYRVLEESTPLKAKALGSFHMLKSVNYATQRNIPEE